MEHSRECNINGADLYIFTVHSTSSELVTTTFKSQPIGWHYCADGTIPGKVLIGPFSEATPCWVIHGMLPKIQSHQAYASKLARSRKKVSR